MSTPLYGKLANLKLTVEDYALEGLSLSTPAGWKRLSTVVHLRGADQEGLGEDVTYQPEDQERFQQAGACLPLAGTFTLEEFSHHLDAHELFSEPPADPKAKVYRRWAFESAALDLALRQAGTNLAAALGRTLEPLRYVVSLGLGDPPSLAPLERLWKRYPGMGLKLDADPSWSADLIQRLAATKTVHAVDLKGQYKSPFKGPDPDPALYRRVAEGLPQAWIEDPGWTDATRQVLVDHQDRVAFDAPICSLADLLKLIPTPKVVNLKPSRFGLVSEVLRTYAWCEARGVVMYGGGQFELGPGRGQIQYLASLFHPDSANDVAPSGFNQPGLPEGLPSSPLVPPVGVPGFRWFDQRT